MVGDTSEWGKMLSRLVNRYMAHTEGGDIVATLWVPDFLKALVAWIKDPSTYLYGRWDAPTSALEGGVDLSTPGGTPVYALADGPIIGAGLFWHSANLYTPNSGNPGYGVVTQRITVPGQGLNDLYYQHININPAIQTCYANNCGSQYLHKGDLIGWTRADVGELEVGFNANWGGVWGINHPAPWATDPRPLLVSLMSSGPPLQLGGQPTFDISPFAATSPGTATASNPPGIPQGLTDWIGNPVRIFKLLGGVLLIAIGLILLIAPDTLDIAKGVAVAA